MTTRTFTTEMTGPIVLAASLLGIGGRITVEASKTCTRATVTLRTKDETGPAAEAVRSGDLGQEGGMLVARVSGESQETDGITQTIVIGGGRTPITQTSTVVSGNVVTGMTIVNGRVISGGNTIKPQPVAPVEIHAVVPAGSSVSAQSDSAALHTSGVLAQVTADTQSGNVEVYQADVLRARTMSGRVEIGRVADTDVSTMSGRINVSGVFGTAKLHTMSGSISALGMAGGRIDADTMSGRIDITATSRAIEQGLRVHARSMSGRVSIPRQCAR